MGHRTRTKHTTSSIFDLNKRWWKKVLEKVNKAVVFVDSAATNSVSWFCNENPDNLVAFFKAGATNVKELSSFERGLPNEKKCVFIVCSPLVGGTIDAIRMVVQASSFEYCVLITPFSAGIHTFAKSPKNSPPREDDEAFYYLEDCLLQWMGNMSYTVEVIHIPISVLPFTPSFFVTPPVGDLYSITRTQLQKMYSDQDNVDAFKNGKTIDLDFNYLLKKDQTKVKMLCEILNSVLEGLDVREDIHTVGNFSKIIAKELEDLNSAKQRRKNCKNKASLLLVDRSLDVPSAVTANTDSLMDRIMRVLPSPPNTECDAVVDVSFLIDAKSSEVGRSVVAGNYAQYSDETCCHIMQSSIVDKQKQTLMELNRALIEALNGEKINIDKSVLKSSKDSAEKIEKLLSLFKGQRESSRKHKEILQQALAIIQTIKSGINDKVMKMVSIEKVLMQALATPDEEYLLEELLRSIRGRRNSGLNIEDILLLLIFVFQEGSVLLDTETPFGHELQINISAAIVEDKELLSDHVRSKVGETDQECHEFVQDFMERLSCLKDAYRDMKTYKTAFEPPMDDLMPVTHKPILRRIMEDIFLSKKTDLIDVEFRASGLGTMLKSGFGLFGASARPRPDDNPILIVFVIGGVTATEVRQINEVIKSSGTNVNVIVGSTRFVRPSDMLKSIL